MSHRWASVEAALLAAGSLTGGPQPEVSEVRVALDHCYRRRRVELVHVDVLKRYAQLGRPPDPQAWAERADVKVWAQLVDALAWELYGRVLVDEPSSL